MEENTLINDPDMLLYDLILISSNEDLVIFLVLRYGIVEIKILNTPPHSISYLLKFYAPIFFLTNICQTDLMQTHVDHDMYMTSLF